MALTAMTGGNESLFARIPWIVAREVRRYKGYPFLVDRDALGRITNIIGKMKIIPMQGIDGLIKNGRDVRTYRGRIVLVIHLGSSEQKEFMISEMNEEIERMKRRQRVSATQPPVKSTAVTED